MSKRIYAELTHDFIRRMQNWASLNGRNGDAQMSPSSMWSAEPGGGYREATMPRLEGEAEDTDRAMSVVPIRYRQAVMLFWQYEKQSMTQLARRCCCERHTYENRVIEGHNRLRSEIYKRNQMAIDMRDQFERLNAA